MTILIKAIQLIAALSLLVFVHELGHLFFAKIFKVRVNKFYLFFNPYFSLVRCKMVGKKLKFKFFSRNKEVPQWEQYPDNTEWGIGWLPLGGYCQIAGMVDETQSAEDLASTPQPWEYRSQKAWKRLLIISGGVLMNFITAIVIYWLMLFTWGNEYVPVKNAYLGYDYCQTALANGFEKGDIILSVDGQSVEKEKDIVEKIIIEGKQNVVVSRGGEQVEIVLPSDFSELVIDANEATFFSMRVPFVVEEVTADSYAGKNKLLQAGDSVVAINGLEAVAYSDIMEILDQDKGQFVQLSFYRGGELDSASVLLTEEGKIGVALKNPYQYFKTCVENYNLFTAFPAGIKMGWNTLVNYVKQFRLVFTAAGAKSVGGFISIGSIFPSVWNWSLFWGMTAMLSVILAFMNFLPIPMLDGGYFIFIIYEMIMRRPPSEKFMRIASNVGFALLIALLVFANANDIFKLFR